MDYQDAKKLNTGDKVRVVYTPRPGHGKPINEVGTVQIHPIQSVPTINLTGTEYVWVLVHIGSEDRANVYPSWCLKNWVG